MMVETEILSYLAGFFDGEGNIFRCKTQKSYRITVCQNQPEVLNLYTERWGGTVYSNRQCHYWVISKRSSVQEFLTTLYPYLVVKKDKAEEALQEIKIMGPVLRSRASRGL